MGRPIVNAHCEAIGLCGEDAVMGWRAEGKTWRQVCAAVTEWVQAEMPADFERLVDPTGKGCLVIGAAGLQKFLHLEDSGAYREDGTRIKDGRRWLLWQEMGKLGAEALVGEARELGDGAKETTSAVAKVKLQMEQRRFEAAKMDRGTYGGDAAVQVNVSVQSLHLEALRGVVGRGRGRTAEVIVVDEVNVPLDAVVDVPALPASLDNAQVDGGDVE